MDTEDETKIVHSHENIIDEYQSAYYIRERDLMMLFCIIGTCIPLVWCYALRKYRKSTDPGVNFWYQIIKSLCCTSTIYYMIFSMLFSLLIFYGVYLSWDYIVERYTEGNYSTEFGDHRFHNPFNITNFK